MTKYVKHLTNDELLQRLADELVRTHQETGIDLGYWETAREVVERFYNVKVKLTITKKKVKKWPSVIVVMAKAYSLVRVVETD